MYVALKKYDIIAVCWRQLINNILHEIIPQYSVYAFAVTFYFCVFCVSGIHFQWLTSHENLVFSVLNQVNASQ
jgi:hypothetical protein